MILQFVQKFINKSGSVNLKLNTIKLLLLVFLIIWIIGFLQPIIWSNSNLLLNFSIDRIYSNVCHQQDNKCIRIAETKMLVCTRCAGIYFGALVSLFFTFFRSTPDLKFSIFILSTIPLLLDVLLTNLNLYNYSQPIAFSTGLIFGSVVCLFLLSEIENLFLHKSINRNE